VGSDGVFSYEEEVEEEEVSELTWAMFILVSVKT